MGLQPWGRVYVHQLYKGSSSSKITPETKECYLCNMAIRMDSFLEVDGEAEYGVIFTFDMSNDLEDLH